MDARQVHGSCACPMLVASRQDPASGGLGPPLASPAVEGAEMIYVENLMKSFRDLRRGLVHAVDGVSFEARSGEIFGLLGPNGAGKTTTMRILCTVLRPTGGTAQVAGHDVATQPALVRQHI